MEFDSTILICGKKWDGVGNVDFSKGEGKRGRRDGERDCTILMPQIDKIPTLTPSNLPLSPTSLHLSPFPFPFSYSHHTFHPISSPIFPQLSFPLSFPTSLHFSLLFSLSSFSKVSFLFLIPFFLELRNFLLCIFIHLFCIFIHTEFLISFLLSIEERLYSEGNYFNF